MNKKLLSILIPFCVIILLILLYHLTDLHASLQYKESSPPKMTANSLKSLVASLIQGEENFAGNVTVAFIDPNHDALWNKAQIKVLNTVISDDSIGPIEYIAIAEKKGEVWKITQYKSHWKCKRDYLFGSSWTTKNCP